jgi:hypothetical protein
MMADEERLELIAKVRDQRRVIVVLSSSQREMDGCADIKGSCA